jgi:hypothetical protein
MGRGTSGVIWAGPGVALATGSSVLSAGGSMGCAGVADFGCHFLRSVAVVSGAATSGGAVAD